MPSSPSTSARPGTWTVRVDAGVNEFDAYSADDEIEVRAG